MIAWHTPDGVNEDLQILGFQLTYPSTNSHLPQAPCDKFVYDFLCGFGAS